MDNFFDYIIILFFIVSALASLLKKKKQPPEVEAKRKEEMRARQEELRRKLETKSKQRSLDPFETGVDIFGRSSRSEGKSEVDDYFEEALKRSREFETVKPGPPEVDDEFHEATKKESREQKSAAFTSLKSEYLESQKKRSLEERMQDIRLAGNEFDAIRKKTEEVSKINVLAEQLKQRLKNKTDLRELIIINELLNKPKALRR